MEIRVEIKTPGIYLSSRTLFWILSDIAKIIYKGIFDGIIETYPNASKNYLRKRLKNLNLLYFTDIKRGSWEIALLAAIGGVVLKLLYDLGVDILKDNSDYKKIKNKINGNVSNNIGKNIKDKLEERNNYGSFVAEKKKIEIEIKPNKTQVLRFETTLIRREGATSDFSGDNDIEIDKAIKEIINLMDKMDDNDNQQ